MLFRVGFSYQKANKFVYLQLAIKLPFGFGYFTRFLKKNCIQ